MKTLLQAPAVGSSPTAAMIKEVFTKAIDLGLSYQPDDKEGPKILPRRKSERWRLNLIEDRWLLSIGNVPQIQFSSQEALAFITRRR